MASHLELGRQFSLGWIIFTPYRALTALAGCQVLQLIALQLLCGIGTALLTSYLALHLSGKKWYALLAGLAAACYAPALLYELATLQESLLVLCVTAAAAAVLRAHRRHFSWPSTLLAGATLAFAGCGRPVALIFVAALGLWCLWTRRRAGKNAWRRTLLQLVCGAILIWGPVSVYNRMVGGWGLPFYGSNHTYMAAVGSQTELTDWNVTLPADQSIRDTAGNLALSFPQKLPRILSPNEVPDNLDLTFIRRVFPPLSFCPDARIFAPLAVAGILLLLGTGRWRRRDGFPLLCFAALEVVVAAYYPTGRHRLVGYPFMLLLALYPFFSPWRLRGAILGLLLLLLFQLLIPALPPRPQDAVNWGLALEKAAKPEDDPVRYYLLARQWSAPGDDRALLRAFHFLARQQRFAELSELLNQQPETSSVANYYRGILAMRNARPAAAEAAFRQVVPEAIAPLRVPYYYNFGLLLQARGDTARARRLWETALQCAPTPAQRQQLEEMLRKNP